MVSGTPMTAELFARIEVANYSTSSSYRQATNSRLRKHRIVFECSSRMDGKPSSPVLRGLSASNGARPLDNWVITSR
jgi:hypothetical protein